MRIAIMGAGSIGGLLGANLHKSGSPITLVDRGERLDRLRKNGLTLTDVAGNTECISGISAIGDAREIGEQDVVILALKAHQITPALDQLCALIGDRTILVPVQNGIPWWYFQRHGGEFDGRIIESADPGGRITSRIDPSRIVGCIAYPAADMPAPAHVVHVEGYRFPVGGLDDSGQASVQIISDLFRSAGFKSPVLEDVRAEIWLKAIGSLSFNPISALTRATLVEIAKHEDACLLARRMMEEGQDIANALGKKLRVSIDRRIEGARRVGAHRSSMLQDADRGEAMEYGALVAAVAELGQMTGNATPCIDNVLALIRLLDQVVTSHSLNNRH